jgi:hypothetical protein
LISNSLAPTVQPLNRALARNATIECRVPVANTPEEYRVTPAKIVACIHNHADMRHNKLKPLPGRQGVALHPRPDGPDLT